MEITEQTETQPGSCRSLVINISAALALYVCITLYLYHPYLKSFNKFDLLYPAAPVLGSFGALLVIFKWSDRFGAAVIGGMFYGFTPLALSTTAYHPLAQLIIIAIPWLFIPVVYLHKKIPAAVSVLLLLLPPAAIVSFFLILSKSSIGPFFPIPLSVEISLKTVSGFAILDAFSADKLPFGFYHIGPILLAVGAIMFILKHNSAAIILTTAAFVLAITGPILEVSPPIWMTIPTLFAAILISQAIQHTLEKLKNRSTPIMITAITILYTAIIADTITSAQKIIDHIF